MLKVEGLRVDLDGKAIFRELSFTLQSKQTLVILGPNGAGKTVLLKTLLGLLPHHGNFKWKDDVKIGYVPQRLQMSKDLPITVEDFFLLKKISHSKTLKTLKEVGLSDPKLLSVLLGHLSSGQLQRVLIAAALSNQPDVLIFDEPTAGIDITGEETIYATLKRAQEQSDLAIILVTHDLSAVYSYASHVLCMNNKTSCYGTPQEILDPHTLQKIYGKEIRYFEHSSHAHG